MGVALGDAVGVALGDAVGVALGVADGLAVGVALGNPRGSVRKQAALSAPFVLREGSPRGAAGGWGRGGSRHGSWGSRWTVAVQNRRR